MNAIIENVCAHWQAGNQYMTNVVGVNPDEVATGEALTALGLVLARFTKRVGNRGLVLPIAAAVVSIQSSVVLQQLVCGSPETAKVSDSTFRELNRYQLSVPGRFLDVLSSGISRIRDSLAGFFTEKKKEDGSAGGPQKIEL